MGEGERVGAVDGQGYTQSSLQFLAFLGREVAMPCCNAFGQNVFCRICRNLQIICRNQSELVEMPNFFNHLRKYRPVFFIGHSVNVVGPEQIIGDIYTQDLEVLDHLHCTTSETYWGAYSSMLAEV